MIAISVDGVQKIIEKFSEEIDVHKQSAYDGLNSFLIKHQSILTYSESEFVKSILDLIRADNSLIVGTPDSLEVVKKKLKGMSSIKNLKKRDLLKEGILKAFDYKGLRCTFYPKYFKEIGIKSCVYCNSQLAVAIDIEDYLNTKSGESVKAKFQVDHYYSKAEYPYLSISLFNLYPVCASCNIVKGNKKVDFQLYSNKKVKSEKSDFKFTLKDGVVSEYLITKNIDVIDFLFEQINKPKKRKDDTKLVEDLFSIQEIYNTQKDLAEELIVKAQIYNKSYREELIKSFPDLINSSNMSSRFFVGNYTEPKDIHKRPMAKFTQDIARDLKLIK